MSNCQSCGHLLRSYDRVCGKCSTPVPKPTCAHCGAELVSVYAFSCRACGKRVQSASSEESSISKKGRENRDGESSFVRTTTKEIPTKPVIPSRNPEKQDFVHPSVLDKVLYVAPVSAQKALQRLLFSVHSAQRGEMLWVEKNSALEQVQGKIREKRGKISSVCILGTDDDIPHVRWENPVLHAAGFEEVETDNPYGMLSSPDQAERMTGHLINDIPVTRIPSLDFDLLSRLLRLHKDIPKGWGKSLSVSAEVWEGATRYTMQHTQGDQERLLVSPPSTTEDVAAVLRQTPKERLLFNVHGHNIVPDWYGEGQGDSPVVCTADAVCVAPNAVVFSEACYGAMVADPHRSIALRFLQRGASCFVGSTIVAWGSAHKEMARGSAADLLAQFFYGYIDQGFPLGEALRAAKLQLLEESQDDNGVISPMIHNTLASFVAYGAPLLRVDVTPSVVQKYAELVASYRNIPDAKGIESSLLSVYRQRLQNKLPQEVWKSLSVSTVQLGSDPVTTKISPQEYAGFEANTYGILSRYRSGLEERFCVVVVEKNASTMPMVAMVVDAEGTVLERLVRR